MKSARKQKGRKFCYRGRERGEEEEEEKRCDWVVKFGEKVVIFMIGGGGGDKATYQFFVYLSIGR